MDEIIKFLLTGYKLMSEMHLRQPVFANSACEPITKKQTTKI